MATAARSRTRHVAGIDCPRCGHKTIRANVLGAWCESFPCRWHVRWATLRAAVAVARKAGEL